ncbi:4-hydroxyphenylpyruvate dioxygenase [Streptomyces iakyrus]
MNDLSTTGFRELAIDHVTLYVEDLDASVAELARTYGFQLYARTAPQDRVRSAAVGRERIRLVLTEAVAEDDPAAVYLHRHGEGVADIALTVPDAAAAYAEAVRRGARPAAQPVEREGMVTASVMAFGDVRHTFVQRGEGIPEHRLPGFVPTRGHEPAAPTGLLEIDHFAVCLEPGQLQRVVEFYEQVLDFRNTFTEKIVVGAQAMDSEVVQNASGTVTLTLIEPDTSREPGQIDFFIKNHGGAGVQHIAFRTENIVRAVGTMRSQGVDFLTTPAAYYRMLGDRLRLSQHSTEELAALNVLADEDHAGQLFQIFTKSVHSRRTLFFEVIERAGATTFGSGNIKALYAAVEAEQLG